jgi:hypothetical protein
MKKSAILHESVFCGQCHGLGPNFEFEQPSQCATAYGSYLFAYVAEGGHETCQSCHMRKLNKGHVIPAYRDPDMAEAAVRFEADACLWLLLAKEQGGGSDPSGGGQGRDNEQDGSRYPGWVTDAKPDDPGCDRKDP